MSKRLTALAAASVLILLSACGNSTALDVPNQPAPHSDPVEEGSLPPVMRCAPSSGSQQVASASSCDETQVRS